MVELGGSTLTNNHNITSLDDSLNYVFDMILDRQSLYSGRA